MGYPKDFEIRDFVPVEYEQLKLFWELTGLDNSARGDDLQTISNTLIQKGKLLVMKYIPSSQLVGSSWITNDGRRLYIHHFAIHPEFQGHRLSKPLMDATMQYAKVTGLQTKLEVHKDNTIALNLYQQYGFKYLGDYVVYINRGV